MTQDLVHRPDHIHHAVGTRYWVPVLDTQESLTMKHYLVAWSIDIDADLPEEAAQKA